MAANQSDQDEVFIDRLKALERRTWSLLCSSGPELLPLLGEQCTMLFPGGMLLANDTSPSVEDTLRSPSFIPWNSYELHDMRIMRLGITNDAAVVCYRVSATRRRTAPVAEGGGGGRGEDEGERREGERVQGVQGTVDGEEPPTEEQEDDELIRYEALVSSTWTRLAGDEDEWRMMTHHQTPV